MTYRELMICTLEKVTGQPHDHLVKVVEKLASLSAPGQGRWEHPVPVDELPHLEKKFEEEAPGILSWYVKTIQTNEDLLDDLRRGTFQEKPKM